MMKKITYSLAFIFIGLLLTACIPAYQQASWWHGGYSDEQLDNNTFRINYKGSGGLQRPEIENYLLYRAAQVTAQEGYDYFVVTDKQIDVNKQQECDSDYSEDPMAKHHMITTFGHESCLQHSIFDGTMVIKLYRGKKPATATTAYSADDLLLYLGSKVHH